MVVKRREEDGDCVQREVCELLDGAINDKGLIHKTPRYTILHNKKNHSYAIMYKLK